MNYGIVAEFNPFHNGHKYIVDTLRNKGENTVTAVMSESFVQRGEGACVSPNERVKMALSCGVDLVLSLPVAYATASAERFADGGVQVLGSLGCIDSLGFGSESGNTEMLKECAAALEKPEFTLFLEKRLNEGVSFPVARQKALGDMCSESFAEVLGSPNDILGIEYIKAINKNSFNINPFAIKRIGVSHDSKDVFENICSASAIREMMKNETDFSRYMPKESADIFVASIRSGKALWDFSVVEKAILFKLRTMSADDFNKIPDVSEGLEFRFVEAVKTSVTLSEILEKVKTKRYTLSRLRRIVVNAFLGITRDDICEKVPYIRVLGFNSRGAQLLKDAKNKATLPVVTKAADIKNLSFSAQKAFELECRARDLYSLCLPVPDVCGKEMTDKLIVFKD